MKRHAGRAVALAVAASLAAALGCGGRECCVGPSADYTIALTPAALAIAQGGTGNATVAIDRTNFTGTVTLSLGNAPAGVSESFSPAAPTGTGSSPIR